MYSKCGAVYFFVVFWFRTVGLSPHDSVGCVAFVLRCLDSLCRVVLVSFFVVVD